MATTCTFCNIADGGATALVAPRTAAGGLSRLPHPAGDRVPDPES